MPWNETCVMDEKLKFIAAWTEGRWSMTRLCERFGISRKTGYKWISRYEAMGVSGLEARSRARHHHSNAVTQEVQAYLLELKTGRFPHWGPRKIRDWLRCNHPERPWPAASTIGELYDRHGLVKRRRRRPRAAPQSEPLRHCQAPNDVWSADFKGQFKLGNGQWCYPLTVSDNASRYVLGCQGLPNIKQTLVQPVFERIFAEFGIPRAIRTDNGIPFASRGLGGLSRLAVWWLRLGIHVERTAPGRPDQNGRHERMHKTLKAEVPIRHNASAQQRAFNRFRREFNEERPHESLDGARPADRFVKSDRPFKNPGEITYEPHFTVRRVRTTGEIRWRGGLVFVSEALTGQRVGLLPANSECWEIYYSNRLLGLLDDRLGRILRPGG